MCGIAGYWTNKGRSEEDLGAILLRMGASIAHRGPDAGGQWADPKDGVGLAHRRLSVIDLSEAGAQPMHSASGRYVLSYNGEIYNFVALRAELEEASPGIAWRGHSDTEVLLAAFERWGLEATLPKVDGMFAIALWDRREKRLVLARDRFGEKPLYYGLLKSALMFASELRPLIAEGRLGESDIDPDAVGRLFQTSYVPAPMSIFRGVRKLVPASWLSVTADDLDRGSLPEPKAYWSAPEAASEAMERPFRGSDSDAVEQLETLLARSVKRRLVADVPVGAMLSGGIDSTCVSAMAQRESSRPLKTFAVGFGERGYDEAPEAAAVAASIGSDHTTLMVGAQEAIDAVPRLAAIYDEPFADSSQISAYLVSRALRERVTVALSGDAGDELFGGYARHFAGPATWKWLQRAPLRARRLAAKTMYALGPARLAALTGRTAEAAGRIYKSVSLLDARSEDDFYARLIRHWPGEGEMAPPGFSASACLPPQADFARRMMLNDTVSYLPDDVLTKVDRAAMSVALEVRIPFLEPDIYRFAWSLPTERLIGAGAGKRPLRGLAAKLAPSRIANRPKQGFAVPLGAWLRGPLRPWAEDILAKSSRRAAFHDAKLLTRIWHEHQTSHADHAVRLWPILMFEAWRDTL